MKQTKLKRIALPALAVLLAVFVLAGTAAGGGGTASGLTQVFEKPDENDNPKNGIYYMASLKTAGDSGTEYWIPKDAENVFLGVKIGGLQQGNVLTAYTISVQNYTTNTRADFNNLEYSISNLGLIDTNNNPLTNGVDNYESNGYKYAITLYSELNGAYSDSSNSLFKIALKGKEASSEKYYQLDISGKASVAGSESSKIDNWKTNDIDKKSFKFYVLDKPVINSLTFYKQHEGTFGDNQQPTFYLYAENTEAEYAVDAGIENYINGVHKIIWTGDNYISIVDSSESNSTKVKVNGEGTATLKVSIKDLDGSEKKATVKVEKWKSGDSSDNKDEATGITSDAGWNFKNNRVITYTVKPGMPNFNNGSGSQDDFKNGWDTWVQVPALTGGNDTLSYDENWLNEDVKASNSNDVKGMIVSGNGDNTITLKDGWGNFTVLKGSAANGFSSASDVTITLTGYRLGDVNTNDDVDITDSALIGMIVANIITDATDENKIYADCNVRGGDGYIDVADILALNKYIVGYKTIKDWAQQTTT